MASDQDRDLRRLAKRYRISFKPPVPSDQWPAMHENTFNSIQKLGKQSYDGYCASIDIRSNEQPWRDRTKYRADWLAKRAARLFSQQRNEAGWRFGLENDILRRFSVEVACPKCRARIWRSEIEACINEFDDMAEHLEERRRSRVPCSCPPDDRPQDYYEIGTNQLFDDRTQEVIIHDPLLRSELPKQEPDRVYGLRLTRNFNDLLSKPAVNVRGFGNRPTIREIIRSSPFIEGSDPLLFPFLILEAKSEKSSNGFDDIQAQTAFPIWALLKLQENLQSKVTNTEFELGPLVWFLASKGDTWRVYGCYTAGDESKQYDVIQLWAGSILFRDNALQLLLIVDYIFDWARDVYRPSILKQLKSLGTGETYDQVSMISDSDVLSMRQIVSNWVQATPSIVDGIDDNHYLLDPRLSLDHQSLLKLPIPNTKLGTLRSALLNDSHLVGLYIKEDNVKNLLQLAGGVNQTPENTKKAAREVVNLLTYRDDILLLSWEDLNNLEEKWTGKAAYNDVSASSSQTGTFYVLVEYATFINQSWDIVREITYLAVDKAAFEILLKYANFQKTHDGVQSMSQKIRPCSYHILCESINCLRSGSPSQILMAALSCVSLALISLPKRVRDDYTPATEKLGFEYIRRSRLRELVSKFHTFAEKKPIRTKPRIIRAPDGGIAFSMPSRKERPDDTSFVRVFKRKENTSLTEHHYNNLCDRCCRFHRQTDNKHHFISPNDSIFSAYGTALVESLRMKGHTPHKHDICIFIQELCPESGDDIALSVIVEDHLQSSEIYHTIRHPVPSELASSYSYTRDTLLNLPRVCWPPSNKQHMDILEWIMELRGHIIPRIDDHARAQENHWDGLQILLFCFGEGKSWESSERTLRTTHLMRQNRAVLYRNKDMERREQNSGMVPPGPSGRT